MSKRLICAATSLGLLLSSALVLAQEPAPQPQPAPAPQAAGQQQFDEQKLENFVEAYVEIMEIQQAYGAKLEGSKPPEEAQRIQDEANGKMIEAIEDQGLDLQEYTHIVNAVDNDPALREQVVDMIATHH